MLQDINSVYYLLLGKLNYRQCNKLLADWLIVIFIWL